eukprot:CAMPEP_0168410690 /NCGR_PEP_ID=MMETSP0228-20121227/27820_1 /TAXON_ID=133427 /ORGANISM="Protoceratium reticulatum, Strain CCCM 535 (=CCMP 1889)" /LENGTH=65 /DNA_ID=CAMNT_0008424423 /DNA_START=74 /DNA_END=267 /DNA_ORIENTATION=+
MLFAPPPQPEHIPSGTASDDDFVCLDLFPECASAHVEVRSTPPAYGPPLEFVFGSRTLLLPAGRT